jgi:hypothetical protein
MYPGCRVNQLQWSMERSGLVTATVGVIAQGEDKSAASQAGRGRDAQPQKLRVTAAFCRGFAVPRPSSLLLHKLVTPVALMT